MYRKNRIKKGLALVTIVLFIGMNVNLVAGDIETQLEHTSSDSYEALNLDDVTPNFEGPRGENGWFLGEVWIWFDYDPARVVEIWYRITGTEWKNYTWHPFSFDQEGEFTLEYKWKTPEGGEKLPTTPTSIKIDKTPPTITLNRRWFRILKTQIFTADITEETSGVDRVEFYLDDELNATYTESPYQYTYKGDGEHMVKAIVYDKAGHSNNKTSSTPVHFPSNTIITRILHGIQSINHLFFQILKSFMERSPFYY